MLSNYAKALIVYTGAISSAFAVEGIVQVERAVSPSALELRVATADDWFWVELPLNWCSAGVQFLDRKVWFAGEMVDHRLSLRRPADFEILSSRHIPLEPLTMREIRQGGLLHLCPQRRILSGLVKFADDEKHQFIVLDRNNENLEIWSDTSIDARAGDRVSLTGHLELIAPDRAILRVTAGDEVKFISRALLGLSPRAWTILLVGVFSFVGLLAAGLVWVFTLRRVVSRQAERLVETSREKIRIQVEADATARERTRLARDLHDGFQQLLAGAMFKLEAGDLEGARQSLGHAQNGLRSVLWMMGAESDGPRLLSGLFQHAVSRLPHWQSAVQLKFEGSERMLPKTHTGALLMILLEGVGNALRHGKATFVLVKVVFSEEALTLTVADNGTGFDVDAALAKAVTGNHHGLANLRRRAEEIGGTIAIESAPFEGATLTVVVPTEGGVR